MLNRQTYKQYLDVFMRNRITGKMEEDGNIQGVAEQFENVHIVLSRS